MNISISTDNHTFCFDATKPFDISIPINFYGAQVNAFGVEKAMSMPWEGHGLIGDTRRGGSCNFEQITLIPHCNGTHTECVGHLTNQRISVNDCLQDTFILTNLISVVPEKAFETGETYVVDLNEDDRLITRKILEDSEIEIQDSNFIGLIVRTMPNAANKLNQTYLEKIPPFFSTEAMEFLNEIGIKHLLIDLPSIDRIYDDGKLSNHRIFWKVNADEYVLNESSLPNKTITELIYVPNNIADDVYLMNLQVAPFKADAAPSRPIIFPLSK